MMYHQMPIPPRSEHLWRYTPWPRIHPTKPDDVPTADDVVFSTMDRKFSLPQSILKTHRAT